MKKYILLFLIFPSLLNAQQNEDSVFIKKISNDVMANGQAYNLLRQLTKEIGGRLAGSPQFLKAVEWGKKTMQNMGADTVFLQECSMPTWIRGGTDKAQLTKQNFTKSLNILSLGNSIGTGGKALTGKVIVINNYTELEQQKDKIKGKIVFYNYGFNPTNISTGKSYGEAGLYRRGGASRAAKYGAIAVIVRSLTEATDNHPHTGTMVYNDSFPKIPAVAIGLEDANYLAKTKNLQDYAITITTNARFLPNTLGYNVVGELKGTEFNNEFITVGGHLDSWDVNEGAHDDGAGVVHTIEVLRVLKTLGYKPKHSIRFVLFANEENGLAGGNKYAELAKQNKEQHIFALESDAGGFVPRSLGFTLNTKEQWTKVMAWLPLLKPTLIESFNTGGGGADIGPLNKEFKTPTGSLNPDGQRYFDLHHAKTDVFENVNKRELLLGALNMAAIIYLIDKYGL